MDLLIKKDLGLLRPERVHHCQGRMARAFGVVRVAARKIAQNQSLKGFRVLWKIVPAVTEV